MGLFDKLSRARSAQSGVEKFLEGLGYSRVESPGEQVKYRRWYCGDLYDTQVTISSNSVYIYEEYNCGGYIDDHREEFDSNVFNDDVSAFETFINELFDTHSYLFDDSLTK